MIELDWCILCVVMTVTSVVLAIQKLKLEYTMLRERRVHDDQMKQFGKIAYHHGFVTGGMRAGYDYDREYPKIKEIFKERWEEKE